MKKLILLIGLLLTTSQLAFPQLEQTFIGDLHFQYSGALNGSFDAEFDVSDTSLVPLTGALAGVWTDSSGTNVLLPAYRPSPGVDQALDLWLMYMKDEDGDLEPQTFEVTPPDLEDPLNLSATFFYIPELDSAALIDLIAPILEGEVDSTNIGDYLIDTLLELLSDAFLPISGSITVDSIDDTELTGSFSGSLMKLVFPFPQMVNISNGDFQLEAPGVEYLPEPPQNVSAEMWDDGVLLEWDLPPEDLVQGHVLYKSEDGEDFIGLADLGGDENSFVDYDVAPGQDYFYYLTAVSFYGLESDPSETVSIIIPGFLPGDMNQDNLIDVLDIVQLANIVIGASESTEYQQQAGDMNGDDVLDVLDIVQIVNIILGHE